METEGNGNDVRAIQKIIARQFASLNWSRDKTADWAAFIGDFLLSAPLYPAARPAKLQTVASFVERMKNQAATTLPSFREVVLGSQVYIFGNVAVALAACENTENDEEVTRNVEMMLFIKDEGVWRIAAQAWDKASDTHPIPTRLLAGA